MSKEGEGAKVAKGKPGRKPKGPQTLPLILSESRNRITKELPIDSETAALIESYATWAAKKGGIAKEEAIILLLGKAVPAFIKKDALFQTEAGKAKPTQADSDSEA